MMIAIAPSLLPDSLETTATHELADVLPQQKEKILGQLRAYLSLNDEALPKIACNCSTQGKKVSISITYARMEGGESLRQLIRSSRFNHSEQAIVKLFEKACLAVLKMHQAGIPHCAIAADRVYLAGSALELDVPAFNLIEKAKRRQGHPPPTTTPPMTYQQLDVLRLALLLLEMLTKYSSEQVGILQLRQPVSSIKSWWLRSLIEDMVGLNPHKRPTIKDVVGSLAAKEMNPEVAEGRGSVKAELLQEITLLPMFLPCNPRKKQLVHSANEHLVIVKENQHLQIRVHWVKNSETLHIEVLSNSKTIASLVLNSDLFSGKAKQAFDSVGSLFFKLEEKDTSLHVNSLGELTISFRPTKKAESDSNPFFETSRAGAALKAQQKMRKKEEEVEVLLIVLQYERNLARKERLSAVEELIAQSRGLPETSKVMKPITKMWRELLAEILNGESVEELLILIKICEKYWLESDEIMNIMKKRLTELLGSGLWMLQ